MTSDKEKESERLKELVREKYAQIAREAPKPGDPPALCASSLCCAPTASPSCCAPAAEPSASTWYSEDVAGIKEAYDKLDGHMDEADLGLGCGLPTEHAGLAPGQTVVDLGSGAGNDVFIARSIVGDTGRVIGVDMTPEMIDKARANAERRGFKNVEFRLGDIEALPVDAAAADVVVSNCVLNLVPDKRLAFAEIFRVLKPGGRFCISDIVLQGELPAKLQEMAELYVGCVAGALAAEEYLAIIHETGFTGIDIKIAKRLDLPDEYILKHIGAAELAAYRASGAAVLSITVVGARPSD
ncbi:MAG: arsenite methyltransferase [Candidatus Aminicenantes bacterium]|nr:arsenite methyltransferase [Candidatus Aminicenantes bacterium]